MEQSYLDLVRHILERGERRPDRTGTGTLSVFGAQLRFDLREGFPLLTTKKVLFHAVARELLWFLRGSTNIHDGLAEHTPIWNPWADEGGELGPIYGYQWRNWNGEGIDQIQAAIDLIRRDPTSRRILVSAWNVSDLGRMALPPCHVLFQLYAIGDELDMQVYQRSADMAVGVPFNIASYSLLLALLAKECGLRPRSFILTFGDAHVYADHVSGLERQLGREPYPPPRVDIADKPLAEIEHDDIQLVGYRHHPFIRFPVAV